MLKHVVLMATLLCSTRALADAPAAPPASPVPPADYDIVIKHAPEALAAQAQGTLAITITPKAPWLLKTTTPFVIALAAPEAVAFKQNKLGARDFADPKAPAKTVNAVFTLKEAGEYHVSVDMMFFLCSDQVCQRHKEIRDYVLPGPGAAAPQPIP